MPTPLHKQPHFSPVLMLKNRLSSIKTGNNSRLEQKISELEDKYEELVNLIEKSLQVNDVKKLQNSIKHIPASLHDQLGEYFHQQVFAIFKTNSIQELFVLLSRFWDYLNPGLLEFIVGRFGSPQDISCMTAYLEDLGNFRATVKVKDYICTRQANKTIDYNVFTLQRIIFIMNDKDWEDKTLQDVEDYKIELSQEFHLQSFLPLMHVRRHSIALVFRVPKWIEINIMEHEEFISRHQIIQVYQDENMVADRTSQVCT